MENVKDFKDILEKKNKETQEEDKKEEKKEVFTQVQREMLKASILKIAMRASQMSEMSGNSDYSDALSQVQGAEKVLEKKLCASSEETLSEYLSQVEERAENEGVSEMDIMAEDAITLKKAELEHVESTIDPTTGRVVVEGQENDKDQEADDYQDEDELSL